LSVKAVGYLLGIRFIDALWLVRVAKGFAPRVFERSAQHLGLFDDNFGAKFCEPVFSRKRLHLLCEEQAVLPRGLLAQLLVWRWIWGDRHQGSSLRNTQRLGESSWRRAQDCSRPVLIKGTITEMET
jgi:hypothetical protein